MDNFFESQQKSNPVNTYLRRIYKNMPRNTITFTSKKTHLLILTLKTQYIIHIQITVFFDCLIKGLKTVIWRGVVRNFRESQGVETVLNHHGQNLRN